MPRNIDSQQADTSESSGYDSEADQHAAYKQRLRQSRLHTQHAACQQDILRKYRVKKAWEQTKRTKTFPHLAGHTPDITADAAAGHRMEWEQHEARWQDLEHGRTVITCWCDIPWPPDSTGVVAAKLKIVQQSQPPTAVVASSNSCNEQLQQLNEQLKQQHRQAYNAALLRWHPDKFMGRLSLLTATEQAAAMQQVQHLMHSLIECNKAVQAC